MTYKLISYIYCTRPVGWLWVCSTSLLYSRVQVEGATPFLGIAVFAAEGKEVMVEP